MGCAHKPCEEKENPLIQLLHPGLVKPIYPQKHTRPIFKITNS